MSSERARKLAGASCSKQDTTSIGIKDCSLPGSNWRPSDYETDALPTEPKERHTRHTHLPATQTNTQTLASNNNTHTLHTRTMYQKHDTNTQWYILVRRRPHNCLEPCVTRQFCSSRCQPSPSQTDPLNSSPDDRWCKSKDEEGTPAHILALA